MHAYQNKVGRWLNEYECETTSIWYTIPRPVRAREGHMTRTREKLIPYLPPSDGVFRTRASNLEYGARYR